MAAATSLPRPARRNRRRWAARGRGAHAGRLAAAHRRRTLVLHRLMVRRAAASGLVLRLNVVTCL